MGDNPNIPSMAECFVDYYCGHFSPERRVRHHNGLVGDAPDGRVVVRPHKMAPTEKIGLTIELRLPSKRAMSIAQNMHLRHQVDMLLEKFGVEHSMGSTADPKEDYIMADIGYQQRNRLAFGPIDETKREQAADEHFEKRIDITYEIPVRDLDKLTQAITELKEISRKKQALVR